MKASILKHPIVILIGAVIGSVIGIYNAQISTFLRVENLAKIIAVPGEIYLFYLQMTVIPIIITAIASSLGKLMRNKTKDGFVRKLVIVFLAGIGITAIVGIVIGVFGQPGAGLGKDTRSLLTNLVSSESQSDIMEISLSSDILPAEIPQNGGMYTFFTSMVPSNIFSALSLGNTMAIVFFSIIFGIAIGLLKEDSATLLINLLSAIFEAFQKLVNSSLYLLPLGLVCLMAEQIAEVGIQIFMAMSKFIIFYCGGTGVLFVICTILIWLRSGQKNPLKVLSVMFEPVVLSLATRNSMAALSSSISSLHQGLGFNKNQVNLTLPLGMTLARFGNIFYFAIAVLFVAQLYGTPLTAASYAVIFLGTILAGTATAGASGIVTISVISIALGPLNLPVEAVLVIFMAIDPIIDPFRTLLLVYANIAATALVVEHGNASVREEEETVTVAAEAVLNDTPAEMNVTVPYRVVIAQDMESQHTPSVQDTDSTAHHTPKKKSAFGNFRVLHAIIFLNISFLIVTTAIILSVMWYNSEKNAQELSNNLITEMQNAIYNKIQNYFIPIENANKTISFMSSRYFPDIVNNAADRQRAFDFYDKTMRDYPQSKMIYYADTFGNLDMLLRMDDGTFSKRIVKNDGQHIITRWEHLNLDNYGAYPNTVELLANGYDPRKRQWYVSAIAMKQMIWTPVYIFATSHEPGFTCSIPIYDAWGALEGVCSIDISVSGLSLFLGSMQPTPGTRIVVIDREENLVAIQAKKEEDIKNLFEEVKYGTNTAYNVRNIGEYQDAMVRSVIRETLKRSGGIQNVEFNNERYKSVIFYISIGSGQELSIGIIVPENDIIGNMRKGMRYITFFSIGILLVIIICSIMFSRSIASPMQILSSEMSKIRALKFDSDLNINTRFLEIAEMYASFEGMRTGLQNFKRYVPSDLVTKLINEKINAEIGGERRELTIFFSDIAKFTSISEKKSPEEMVKDLCFYFENVSKIIIENKGTLDKYIGDSVMAFWGAPVANEHHAEAACRSAVRIQQMLRSIFRQWENMGKEPFYTRIGIHTGEAIVGNMGYTERLNYTVIGDHVNVASRLEGVNKIYGTKIIVSQNTWSQCANMFEFRMLDKISVVGRSEGMAIYELYSEKNDIEKMTRKIFDCYEIGLRHYFDREWDEAMKCFETVLKYRHRDAPSLVMSRRCINYKKNPPPEEWDGVYKQTAK
ncbi:MAG: cation:dicarboxylase symporter family transporter [Spirochaetaceae bacterium]|jgi:adenylate cyclase|nr:cation:dicarboxylase symporter family transporter [Spirochaetaceae bacterium]